MHHLSSLEARAAGKSLQVSSTLPVHVYLLYLPDEIQMGEALKSGHPGEVRVSRMALPKLRFRRNKGS